MASLYWIGGAAKVVDIRSYTFAGTWETDDITRVTIGSKKYDFIAGSTVVATIIDSIVTAWNDLDAADWPEFAEMTASRNGSDLVLTMDEAGVPFIVTLTPLEADFSPAGAQTIEGGGVATTGTVTQAATGPEFWSDAHNWSSGVAPVTGDTVFLQDTEDDIKYGLAQSGQTLTVFNIYSTFTGTLGLPKTNSNGSSDYPEYRADYLVIGATTLLLNDGLGQGSGRIKIDNSNIQTAVTVRQTGSAQEAGLPAFLWKGTHAANIVNVLAGSAGIAWYGGEVATVVTLNVNFISNQDGDSQVRCGAGVTLTTIVQTGGELVIGGAVTTVKKTGGTLTIEGAGAVTTLTNDSGLCFYRSSGTITTLNIGDTGVVDFAGDMRAKTVTNCTITGNGVIFSPSNRLITWTNPLQLTHRGNVGGLGQVAFGDNISIAIAYL